MQRSKSADKRKYVRSGVKSHQTPGGRKISQAPKVIRRVIFAAVILLVVVLIIYGISSLPSANKPVLLNAKPTDNIQAFGENVLYYDGMTLSCVGPNGSSRWQYTLGIGADFSCTADKVVAWNGNQIHVLDKNGTPSYSDTLASPIRFARIGEVYVAACMGELGAETSSAVQVMSHTGGFLETISLEGLYPFDVGFFSSKGQLMWVLSLDIDGNVPITNIATYEPGRLSTGAAELDNTLVYRVYLHNNMLMLADTNWIRTYNYKCVEQADISPVLVYGWQIGEVRGVGKNTYALLEQVPSSGSASTFSELRMVTNFSTQASFRLLSPCFASGLGDKGVYAFGDDVIYHIPYGTNTVKPTRLSYTLTDFICTLDGGRAVLVSGTEVFVQKLPE